VKTKKNRVIRPSIEAVTLLLVLCIGGLWLIAMSVCTYVKARDLAEQGIVIVGGMARGIDSAGHRGALNGGGKTKLMAGLGPYLAATRRARLEKALRLGAAASLAVEFMGEMGGEKNEPL